MRTGVARDAQASGQNAHVSHERAPSSAYPYGTVTRRRDDTSTRRAAGPFSPFRLAMLRLSRSWHLLLAVALGMLVAIVLICTVPLYDSLIANVQLQHILRDAGPLRRNMEVRVQSDGVSSSAHTALDTAVSSLIRRYLAPYVDPATTYYVTSDATIMSRAGGRTYNVTDLHTPQITFAAFDYASAAPHMRILAGQLPQSQAANAVNATTVPVMITTDMAQFEHITVGDALESINFGDHSHKLTLRVSGIWEPADANDPYWNGLTFLTSHTDNTIAVYPVLMPQDTFFATLQTFAGLGMTQHWIAYTRSGNLTSDNATSAADAYFAYVAHAKGDLPAIASVSNVTAVGDLTSLIRDAQSQQSLLELPLYAIVLQIVGLALLFIAAMATLLIESQHAEIATLKSRGASGVQLLIGFTLQAALLALLTALVSPILAALLSLTLVRWFVPSSTLGDLTTTNLLSRLATPQAVILPALVGVVLGVGAVAVASLQSTRLDVLAFRREQGRQSRPPLWRRYYLDLGLVVLCIVGYAELTQFGGVDTRTALGATANSPLLLVTPALLLLAGALVVLRVFPLGAGFGARLAQRGRGLTTLLAFAQVERSPGRYSRMTLLLVLSVGLGLFALTFDTSLQRNAYDRAAYTIGADLRITESYSLPDSTNTKLAQQLASLSSVRAVSPALRASGSVSTNAGTVQVDTLAIDTATFAQVAGPTSWRDDYASRSLDALLGDMRAHQIVDANAASTGQAPLWAIISDSFAQQAHVKAGERFTLQLSNAGVGATSFVVGAIVPDFPTLFPARAPGGFVVMSLSDELAALWGAHPSSSASGANEFWLGTTGDAASQEQVTRAVKQINPEAREILSLRDTATVTATNPVAVGMRGLLLVGAFTAALLAILGSIIQAVLVSRQRFEQFAVLRTVGMTSRQIGQLLLGEQVVVYFFGLVGGTLLGALLTAATLPFLQFSDVTLDPSLIGVPPYLLTFNVERILLFYLVVLVAFALALLASWRFAASIALGKALRIGED